LPTLKKVNTALVAPALVALGLDLAILVEPLDPVEHLNLVALLPVRRRTR
jgi:hypothetical protein